MKFQVYYVHTQSCGFSEFLYIYICSARCVTILSFEIFSHSHSIQITRSYALSLVSHSGDGLDFFFFFILSLYIPSKTQYAFCDTPAQHSLLCSDAASKDQLWSSCNLAAAAARCIHEYIFMCSAVLRNSSGLTPLSLTRSLSSLPIYFHA